MLTYLRMQLHKIHDMKKGKINTTTVLLHNETPNNKNLARYVAEKKGITAKHLAVVVVEDWDYVSVNNYEASVYCGPNAPATGPMPQRDIIVRVKYRVLVPGKIIA